MRARCVPFFFAIVTIARLSAAQTPAAQPSAAAPKEPPPLWDVQIGASFVGTSGNSDTSSTGADFSLHRRWPIWQLEATATAVKTSSNDVETAERYLASVRGKRKLTSMLALSAGAREEDRP